jgi:hypothetical protein
MVTGRQAAEAALVVPLTELGWQARVKGWFTKPLTDGRLGVLALGVAVEHAVPGSVSVTVQVGLRDEAVEALVDEIHASRSTYRQRTAVTGIGYLMPERRWYEWEISEQSAPTDVAQIAAVVHAHAEPVMAGWAGDDNQLLHALRHSAAHEGLAGLCREVALLTRMAGPDTAGTILATAVHELGDRQDPAAHHVRAGAIQLWAWLAARPASEASGFELT